MHSVLSTPPQPANGYRDNALSGNCATTSVGLSELHSGRSLSRCYVTRRRVTPDYNLNQHSVARPGAMWWEVASICVRSGWLLFADSRGGPTPGWGIKWLAREFRGTLVGYVRRVSELHFLSGTSMISASA